MSTEDEISLSPSNLANKLNSPDWELLLKDLDRLNIRSDHHTPLPYGTSPRQREIGEYIRSGFINFDKSSNPSRLDVVTCIKKILRIEKTNHSGTLEPKGTKCLIVCLYRAKRLRRVLSETQDEYGSLCTMHQLSEAQALYDNHKDESLLRQVIHPLERLLINYKRIMMKDTAVSAICNGAKIMLMGVLRYENNIEVDDEIVLITTKGEAICLAYALMSTATIGIAVHGVVAKIKRVIMDRDTYPKKWGLGERSRKRTFVASGKLDNRGRPDEWLSHRWCNYDPSTEDQGAKKRKTNEDNSESLYTKSKREKKRSKILDPSTLSEKLECIKINVDEKAELKK